MFKEVAAGALDDAASFAVLNDRKFSGIFQFTGATLQQIAIEVKVDSFRNEQWSHRYLGSLQLLASEKTAGSRSFPQIFLPARRGCCRKCAFRSVKYRSIAVLASSTDL